MYADRLEGEAKPSIKDRLNGNVVANSVGRRTVTGKRFKKYGVCLCCLGMKSGLSCKLRLSCSLYKPSYYLVPRRWSILNLCPIGDSAATMVLFSYSIVYRALEAMTPLGLTLSIGSEARKLGGGDLRLKLLRKNSQEDTQVGGVRDLREKLAGSMHSQPMKKDPPRPKPEPEAVKPARRSVIGEALVAESKKVSDSVSRKKSQQKGDASVDGFLRSLGLEKYLITFQAEEVDMAALEHMTDEDLKAIGIPMGPRKKIILALNSRS